MDAGSSETGFILDTNYKLISNSMEGDHHNAKEMNSQVIYQIFLVNNIKSEQTCEKTSYFLLSCG